MYFLLVLFCFTQQIYFLIGWQATWYVVGNKTQSLSSWYPQANESGQRLSHCDLKFGRRVWTWLNLTPCIEQVCTWVRGSPGVSSLLSWSQAPPSWQSPCLVPFPLGWPGPGDLLLAKWNMGNMMGCHLWDSAAKSCDSVTSILLTLTLAWSWCVGSCHVRGPCGQEVLAACT